MLERLRILWYLIRYSPWYHVEIMESYIDTRYGKLTSTVVCCTDDLNDALVRSEYYEQKGKITRVARVIGYARS